LCSYLRCSSRVLAPLVLLLLFLLLFRLGGWISFPFDFLKLGVCEELFLDGGEEVDQGGGDTRFKELGC
jgi:hypothetical protein